MSRIRECMVVQPEERWVSFIREKIIYSRMEYEGCNLAVRNITPKMAEALPEIEKMIFGIPVLTDTQKKFYLAVMKERYEKIFQPVCRKIMEHQMVEERQPDTRKERRCR